MHENDMGLLMNSIQIDTNSPIDPNVYWWNCIQTLFADLKTRLELKKIDDIIFFSYFIIMMVWIKITRNV
jgi:hypothetical protein